MKKTKFVLIVFGLLFYYDASAQVTIERSAIGSAGSNVVMTGNNSASWTVGESMTGMATSGTITLSEGFQQPASDESSGVKVNTPNIDLTVYPNPTQDKVTISIDATKAQSVNYDLYSLLGQKMSLPENTMQVAGHSEKSLDFRQLPKGTYMLRFTSKDGAALSTIKIIKN